MSLNTDPWTSALVNNHQGPRRSLAHPCLYFCGQYAGMIQAIANAKGILHKQQEQGQASLIPLSYSHSTVYNLALTPQTPPHALVTQISACITYPGFFCRWVAVTAHTLFQMFWTHQIYIYILQCCRALAVLHGAHRGPRAKLYVMYIWILCFRKHIVAVSQSVPLGLKWEIVLGLFYILM